MRLRFFVYMLYATIAVIFYSFLAHWIQSPIGWLAQMGVHDFAGGAQVHIFGGLNGLVATLFLGPRLGRFDGSRPISDFFPSSVSSQCLGMLALWWGWIGFNCGSSFGITDDRWVVAIRCSVTTINATVGGGLMAIIYTLLRTKGRLVIPEHLINGILGSLVAITPSCASVHTWDAFPIGIIGALVGLGVNTVVCHFRVDDPVGAVGVHLGSGIWGIISVGLFADNRLPGIDVRNGLFRGGGFQLLGVQLLAIAATVGWSLMFSTSFFYIVGVCLSRDWKNPRKGLRVDLKEEERGADWYLHGVIDQEAYLADLKKEQALTGEDESVSYGDDDQFYEDGNGGRKQELFNKSDMYMRTIFNGHMNDFETSVNGDCNGSYHSRHDAEEKLTEQDEDESGEKTNLNEDESDVKDRQTDIPVRIQQGESDVHDGEHEAKRESEITSLGRSRPLAFARSGLGLNGGLGQAAMSRSVLNEMDHESLRRLRRAPRNVGVLSNSIINHESIAVNEDSDRRSKIAQMRRRSSGERHLKIYR
eukprot:CAMPEP_0181107416 /NCGR_PEP_ID=MMETSP1071-20121207/17074_1 /TAXON_ID=35127 /ORGANISM="Thalassiosira sp., Strain NH16" /LENGTH=531 /DNA_ID=CAMNT_0023190929 /DNA_START=464 /DNA_END=2059 /DNA_ORIENTATION=+